MFGTYKYRKNLERYIHGNLSLLSRIYRYPIPFSEPWRNKELEIARNGGIGDVLLCTPALREAKKRNPKLYIKFYTSLPELIRGLPYIDEVLPFPQKFESNNSIIRMIYEDSTPLNTHIARYFGNSIGLNIKNVKPDCMVNHDLINHYKLQWGKEKTIVVLLRASQFTPNKNWPLEYWDELIEKISKKYLIILIGSGNIKEDQNILSAKFCIDLRNKTTLEEMIGIIASSNMYLGPVSGPYHIAASLNCHSMIINGGYEHSNNTFYSNSTWFSTDLPCSPCWLRTECPYLKKCLTSIFPKEIEKSISVIIDKLYES
jgi:ADP-heptose:LPS heptosyltransferase